MIIPTAEFDPMFAEDGVPFQTKMIDYIKREFGELLGSRAGLLQTSQGLDIMATMYSLEKSEAITLKAA